MEQKKWWLGDIPSNKIHRLIRALLEHELHHKKSKNKIRKDIQFWAEYYELDEPKPLAHMYVNPEINKEDIYS